MEKVIISQNKHWDEPFKNLYGRDVFDKLLLLLPTKHIQVLQGIRRSGKSTLFRLMINHLSQSTDPQEILYANLDDPFFIKYSHDPQSLYEVVQTAKKLTGKGVKYLFLDEVQAISGWEKYVKSVYDSGAFEKIFITGSNSSFLDGELATLLSGRYMSVKVYPLSFHEILRLEGIDSYLMLNKELPKVLSLVDNMMKFGSFVEVYELSNELKRELLKTYYETILLKDCVANNAIREIKGFRELSFYAISNIASLYSHASMAKAVGIHDKSVKEYISYLEDSYLFSELKLFSYSLKEQQNNKKKLYLSDNGFLALAFSFSSNYGKLIENLVFSEFQKMGYELYFYNKESECDFIARRDSQSIAVQVCYALDEQNSKREFAGLTKLSFEVDEKLIISYNQKRVENGIKVIPFWEYFSGLEPKETK